MISRHSFSRWVLPVCMALQMTALISVSGQESPRSPPRPLVRRPLIGSEGERALGRARAAMKEKNFAQAYTEYRSALNLFPRPGTQHDEALRGFSESGIKLAEERLKEGRASEAARIAREVLSANANYRPALELLARSSATTNGPIVRSTPPPTRSQGQTFTRPAQTPEPRTAPTPVPRTLVSPRILSTRPPTTSAEPPRELAPRATAPPKEEPPVTAESTDIPEEAPPPTPRPRQQQQQQASVTPAGIKQPLVKVFFATDRKHISGASGPSNYFGTERNRETDDEHLLTGVVTVSIPPVHKEGAIERPFKWWIIEFKEDEKKHIVLRELKVAKGNDFYSLLRTEYDKRSTENRSAFVFIHGFNTGFDTAAYRTAQLAYDLDFQGVPIMYSWPSQDSMLAYDGDQDSAEWSWSHLQYFLERIARESGALRIHLIAHSMGNRLLVNALEGLGRQPEIMPLFDNVIMAAPDVNAETFTERTWPGIKSAAKRFTLYASSDDGALILSRKAKGGSDFVRLGEGGPTMVVIPGLDTVDASGIDTSELGHSYVACKKVMDDLRLLMATGFAPLERKLLDRRKGELAYWAFP